MTRPYQRERETARRNARLWAAGAGGRSGLPAPMGGTRQRGGRQPGLVLQAPDVSPTPTGGGETITVAATTTDGLNRLVWSAIADGPVRAGFSSFADSDAVLTVSRSGYYQLHITELVLAATGGANVTVTAGTLTVTVATSGGGARLAPTPVSLGVLVAGTDVAVTCDASLSTARVTLELVDIGAPQATAAVPTIPNSTGFWYDASELTAGSLATWDNLGDLGALWDADTGATSPTVVADTLNSLPVVRFGANATLSAGTGFTGSDQLASPWLVGIVMRYVTPVAFSRTIADGTSGTPVVGCISGTVLRFQSPAIDDGVPDDGWHVWVWRVDDTTPLAQVYKDGSLVGQSSSVSSLPWAGMQMGDTSGQAFDVAELVGQPFTPADATAEIDALNSYLTSKWGL